MQLIPTGEQVTRQLREQKQLAEQQVLAQRQKLHPRPPHPPHHLPLPSLHSLIAQQQQNGKPITADRQSGFRRGRRPSGPRTLTKSEREALRRQLVNNLFDMLAIELNLPRHTTTQEELLQVGAQMLQLQNALLVDMTSAAGACVADGGSQHVRASADMPSNSIDIVNKKVQEGEGEGEGETSISGRQEGEEEAEAVLQSSSVSTGSEGAGFEREDKHAAQPEAANNEDSNTHLTLSQHSASELECSEPGTPPSSSLTPSPTHSCHRGIAPPRRR